jgi:hypothetical protein
MSTRNLRRACAVVALALPLLTSGCGDKDIIDPSFEVPEKRSLVVIPFEDMGQNGFLSDRGANLSVLVAEALKAKHEFAVVSKEKVLQLYNEGDPRTLTAAQVAQKTGADYVLMGSILRWQTHDPKFSSSLWRGDATVEITLYETGDAAAERLGNDKKKGEESAANLPIQKKRVSAFYPHEYGTPEGSYDIEMSEEKIDAGLRARTAQEISWLLIPHSKDEDHLAKGR